MARQGPSWTTAGTILLGLVTGIAGLWALTRNPVLFEMVAGGDIAPAIIPAAGKADRVKEDRLPDVDSGRPSFVSAEERARLLRVGRPSVDDIWTGRMALAAPNATMLRDVVVVDQAPGGPAQAARVPSPADTLRGAQPQSTADTAHVPDIIRIEPDVAIAYASARSTETLGRDPFAIIDRGAIQPPEETVRLTPGPSQVPMPLPRPQVAAPSDDDEEDEDEEETAVPMPLPRPRNIPTSTTAVNPPLPARAAPTALVPAAPAPAPSRAPASTTTAAPAPPATRAPATAEQPRIQVAALPSATERSPIPERPATPPLMTPFGTPFLLQHSSVQTNCFPPALVELLRRIERHYGQKPVVTSGHRTRGRSGSLHRRCMAADIMVPGVSSQALARFARTVPGMGGVGQYCHPNMVHVDIGTARDWKYGCGSFFAMRDGSVARGRVPQD
jgi:hypothetical protein